MYQSLANHRSVKHHASLVVLSAAFLSVPAPAGAAGGSCLPRALTPAETAMGDRVAAELRPLLPSAPPGWKIVDADHSDVASGTCLDSATKKMVPQPVSVLVSRKFMRTDPLPATAAAQLKPAAAAAEPDPKAEARAAALEQQINALKVKEQEASRAYTAARVKGDSEAQRTATQEAREYRTAQGPLQKELMEIRTAQRLRNNAASKASTDAAFARAKEELANRPVASLAILVNSDQASARAANVVTVPGVDLALRDSNGKSHLLFGKWKRFGSLAANPFDPSLPTTRVQDAIVDISGSDEVTEQLMKKLDFSALRKVMER